MCNDFHARRIPALASPTLCAHGAKRDQGHCSIPFAHSNTVLNLESSISVISRYLWQLLPSVWLYHSSCHYQSNSTASPGSQDSGCTLPRQIHIVREVRYVRSHRKRSVLGCTLKIVQHETKLKALLTNSFVQFPLRGRRCKKSSVKEP